MESTDIFCKQIEQNLDAFHDGELPAAEQAAIEKHLAQCGQCVNKLAEIDRLLHTLKTMPRAQVSDKLAAKLDAIADSESKVVAFPTKVWAPLAAAAAVVALVLAARVAVPGNNGPVTALKPQQPSNPVARQIAAPPQVAQQPSDRQPPAVIPAQPKSASAQPEIARVPDSQPITHTPPQLAHEPALAAKPQTAPDLKDQDNQPTAVVAQKPMPTTASANPNSNDTSDDELAELPSASNALNEAIGISTDEDGLYDLKM